tara:strand:+ start:2446 stop:2634 length:189 start_codon:yes stop_codon:yes gene_type:complete
MRDVRSIQDTKELVDIINDYLAAGADIVALEHIDESVEDFYFKSLNDDDIDLMAAENAELPE